MELKEQIIKQILDRDKENKNINDTADAIIDILKSKVALINIEDEIKRQTLSTYQSISFRHGSNFIIQQIENL